MYTIRQLTKIQAAFKVDCEEILKKYSAQETHSFEKFSKIWRETHFSLIYSGVKTFDDMTRQTEVFLFEAKKYFLYAPNLYFKTAAFYLLYGIYYKQPLKEFIKIRLLHNEFDILNLYIKEMTKLREPDVLFVYAKLTNNDAFDYVYTQVPSAVERQLSIMHFKMKDDTFQENAEQNTIKTIKELIENDNISEVTKCYEEELKEYLGKKEFMSFDTDIQKELKRIFDSPSGSTIDKSENIGEKRSRLKKKAAGKSRLLDTIH